MKQTLITLTFCLAFSSLWVGCSKPKNAALPAGNSNTADNGSSQPAANSTAQANGPAELKLKWEMGKTYTMEMSLNQNSEIDIPDRPQPMEQVMKLSEGYHFLPVKDLDNGGHQVELDFDSEALELSENGRDMINFDSTKNATIAPNDPAAPVAAVMRAMLGVPLDYTFGADGLVEKIDGTDALQSRINAAAGPQQRAQMQQMFSKDTLKQYASFGESLPDHPVNIGDTWTVNRDLTTPAGVMTINMTYTFKDWQQVNGHNCAHMVATGDIATKAASIAMAGVKVDIQSGTISGDDWFDPALGMMVALNSDQDLTMKITARGRTMMEKTKQNIQMSLADMTP